MQSAGKTYMLIARVSTSLVRDVGPSALALNIMAQSQKSFSIQMFVVCSCEHGYEAGYEEVRASFIFARKNG